jgi:hypothetical protein
VTKRPITVHYSINWQQPEPILSVPPLIIGVLVVFQLIYVPCYIISDENVTEHVAEKIGQDRKTHFKLNGYACQRCC